MDVSEAKVVSLHHVSEQRINRLNMAASNFFLQKPGEEAWIGAGQFSVPQKFKPSSWFSTPGKKKKYEANGYFNLFIYRHCSNEGANLIIVLIVEMIVI